MGKKDHLVPLVNRDSIMFYSYSFDRLCSEGPQESLSGSGMQKYLNDRQRFPNETN